VVAGDPRILGVVGASRCDEQWPPGGILPSGTATIRGYAANAVTFRALLDVLERGADVVLCQLDNRTASPICSGRIRPKRWQHTQRPTRWSANS
jgi:hypothetical protein